MDFCEPRSHVLDGSQVLPVEGRIWAGNIFRPIIDYGNIRRAVSILNLIQ